MPRVTFTAGTPRSVGVTMRIGASTLQNIFVVGFNLAVLCATGGTTMDHVAIDGVNGIDFTRNGANGVYRDLTAGEHWSSSASRSHGVASISGIVNGGTLSRPATS